jgi:hypothetical protein
MKMTFLKGTALIAVVCTGLLLGGSSRMTAAEAKDAGGSASTNRSVKLPATFLKLVKEKRALEERIAKKHGLKAPSQVWDFFTAAEKGDWAATRNLFYSLEAGVHPRSGEPWLPKPLWGAIHDTFGVYEEIEEWSPEFLNLVSSGIVKSVPAGSIYFGGNDIGRFGPTLQSTSHSEGRPFFTLTQNALADEAYLGYLRDMYGEKIFIPGTNEAARCIAQYIEDATQRLKHDEELPNEPRQIRPGEDVRVVAGKTEVGGQVAVMGMNALIVKTIFDKNPRHEFYYEESFPLDWLNPHLTPHQFIFKVNRQPSEEMPAGAVRADREFWSGHADRWLGAWLETNTPVREVTNFVIRTFLEKELKQFKGDLRFIQDGEARKSFSKLRCAVGGLYTWRATTAKQPEERRRMVTEADFAFRQAFAFAPNSPETVFRYVSLLMMDNRIEDALRVAGAAQSLDPANGTFANLVSELSRMRRSRASDL